MNIRQDSRSKRLTSFLDHKKRPFWREANLSLAAVLTILFILWIVFVEGVHP